MEWHASHAMLPAVVAMSLAESGWSTEHRQILNLSNSYKEQMTDEVEAQASHAHIRPAARSMAALTRLSLNKKQATWSHSTCCWLHDCNSENGDAK